MTVRTPAEADDAPPRSSLAQALARPALSDTQMRTIRQADSPAIIDAASNR